MTSDPGQIPSAHAERLTSYAVRPGSIRVYQGYRRTDLAPADFLRDVGQTFMPGTPYMLAPLGCAAYLPGVVIPEDPLLPQEFALIAYPSVEVWQNASRGSLRGRVYTQTHFGVYAATSHAAFPVPVAAASPSVSEPYYAFDRASDWQTGTTMVLLATGSRDGDGPSVGARVLEALRGVAGDLDAAGVEQVIVLSGPTFVIAWVLVPEGEIGLADPVVRAVESGADLRSVVQATPVPVRDEPPGLELVATSAFNYLFLRDSRMFL